MQNYNGIYVQMPIIEVTNFVLNELNESGQFFRLENDETGFWLSVISRSTYPRVWADNMLHDDTKIITESTDSLIQRTLASSNKDWKQRFFGETITDCLNAYFSNQL